MTMIDELILDVRDERVHSGMLRGRQATEAGGGGSSVWRAACSRRVARVGGVAGCGGGLRRCGHDAGGARRACTACSCGWEGEEVEVAMITSLLFAINRFCNAVRYELRYSET